MKFDHNPKYTTIAIYALIVLIIAMICFQAIQGVGSVFGFFGRVAGFVTPVIYGVAFAFLLNPLLRLFDDRLFQRLFGDRLRPVSRRVLSLVCTYLAALLLIGLFIAIVLPQLVTSLLNIFGNVPNYVQDLTRLYLQAMQWLDEFLLANAGDSALAAEFATRVNGSVSFIMGTLYELMESSIGAVVSFTTSLTSGIINLVLGLIVSIYILMDREKLFAQLKKIGKALFTNDFYNLLEDIAGDINRIFSGFVIGKVIDSLIIGVICFVGMSIFRFPYAVLISVIVGLTNVIPYFGPFIGAVPGFVIIFIASPVQSVWFLIFILLLQQLDGNVIGPKILGDTIGLSPLWIIFSIMLFSGLMGVLGMFIGVPLFALIYNLIKRLVGYLLRRKGESDNTRDYDSSRNPLIK